MENVLLLDDGLLMAFTNMDKTDFSIIDVAAYEDDEKDCNVNAI